MENSNFFSQKNIGGIDESIFLAELKKANRKNMITKQELLDDGWGYYRERDVYSKGQYWELEIHGHKIKITNQSEMWYYGLCENTNDLKEIKRLLGIK